MNNDNREEILKVLETGIANGKKAKRRKKIINSNLIGLLLMVITFSVSVNVSSTFASSMIDLPVIGKIVDFIRIGSGYEEVAEKGLFSKGEEIFKDNKYEISVEGYYYSDNKLNVILKLEGDLFENHLYSINNLEILDNDGNNVSGGSISYGTFDIVDDYAIGDITISQVEGILPEEILLRFNIKEKSKSNEDQSIDDETTGVKADTEYLHERLEVRLKKQIEEVNVELFIDHSLESNDIHIDIEELTITPTTMNLTVNAESDFMIFYDFKSIYFESEGKMYYPISNGITRSGDMDHGYTYYFESSYFQNNKPLTLVIEGIYALPKENSTFVIDTETKKVIKDIDDNLKFMRIEDSGSYYYLHFEGALNQEVGFSEYNNQNIMEVAVYDDENAIEYRLKVDKKYITDSLVEIEFWEYPSELELNEEITIID